MRITDKEAIRLLKRANSPDLEGHVATYPEEERDGQSDLDIVLYELDYLVDMYENGGTVYSEDLEGALKIMEDTHNGKSIPLLLPEFEFKYAPQEVINAKSIVQEYKRLKKLLKEYS